MLANKHKDIYETFLQQLKTSIKTKNRQILIIQGDFNARIGRCFRKVQHKGVSAKGCESNNGSLLNEFMVTNNFIATNTLFKHLTTWQEKLKDKTIHNTMDYILSYNRMKRFIIDSKSCSGITTSTDHRLVKMKLTITKTHQILKQTPGKTRRLNPINNFPNLASNKFSNIETFQNTALKSALKSFKKLENNPTLDEDSDTKTLKNKFNRIGKN